MTDDWPFDDAKNVACFTTRQVMDGAPIVFVSHDADDGAWQFLGHDGAEMKHLKLVALAEVYKLHPDIGKLAMLPTGWEATRDSADAEWEWAEAPSEGEDGEDADDDSFGYGAGDGDDRETGEDWKKA